MENYQKKAWSRQKQLKKRYKEEDVPDIDELVVIIENIIVQNDVRGKYTKRARALFAMYYLTGCRASEIVRCNKLRKQKIKKNESFDEKGIKRVSYELDESGERIIDRWVKPHDYEGIYKRDIKFERIDGKMCMFIRTENRKNKDKITKRQPIPIDLETEIVFYITDYMENLGHNDLLFPFGVKRATQIINETTGFNIHFIRHIRATHLITKYDFNEQLLIKFMGWTDGRPAKHYMELKSTDVFRQFYKGGNTNETTELHEEEWEKDLF